MKSIYLGFILLAGAVMSGCGGGSSSAGAGAGGGSSSQAKVSITTTNQSTITNKAIESATKNMSGNLSTVSGVQTSNSPTSVPAFGNMVDYAFNKIIENQNAPLTVSGVVVSTTQCSGGGNTTIDTDGTATVVPTYFTIAFNNCIEGGTTATGTISLASLIITKTVDKITGIAATFAFNLTVTGPSPATSGGIYGGFTIQAAGIKTASRSDSMNGISLSYKYGTQYETLSNFLFKSTYNDTTSPHGYSDIVNYTFASDVIVAGFDFVTVASLVRDAGDTYPRSGQVVITGAGGTKLRVTVLAYNATTNIGAGSSTGKVTLELDQGTGTYGTAVTKTWSQLAAGQ